MFYPLVLFIFISVKRKFYFNYASFSQDLKLVISCTMISRFHFIGEEKMCKRQGNVRQGGRGQRQGREGTRLGSDKVGEGQGGKGTMCKIQM